MKNLLILFAVLFIATMGLASWKSDPANRGRGQVWIGTACGVLDGDGNFIEIGQWEAKITPNGNGRYTCKGSVDNETGKSVRFDYKNTGFLCAVDGAGETSDWQNLVTASGEATLECRFRSTGTSN